MLDNKNINDIHSRSLLTQLAKWLLDKLPVNDIDVTGKAKRIVNNPRYKDQILLLKSEGICDLEYLQEIIEFVMFISNTVNLRYSKRTKEKPVSYILLMGFLSNSLSSMDIRNEIRGLFNKQRFSIKNLLKFISECEDMSDTEILMEIERFDKMGEFTTRLGKIVQMSNDA